MKEREIASILGAVLKCAPVEDDFEYLFMFDLAGVTFLQKLIPKRLMDRKLNLASEGLLRALLVLDFFTSVIAGTDEVLDNLHTIYKKLLRTDEQRTPVPLRLVVVEIGLFAREKDLPGAPGAARRRFGAGTRCACDREALDPFYEGMGFLLASQLARPEAAARVACKADYKAAVFCDALQEGLPPRRQAKAARALADGRYLDAALAALSTWRETVTLEDLEGCL